MLDNCACSPYIGLVMNEHSNLTPRIKVWLIIVTVWSANILLMSSQTYYSLVREGRSPDIFTASLAGISYSVLWMIFTPLVLWFGRKFPLERETWGRNLSIHIALSFIVAITHNLLSNAIVWYIRLKPGDEFFFYRLWTAAIGFFDYGLLVYWIILMIQQAVAYYRRVQERELKASQLETQLVQAQLQALKMQLHPHFLFNTLHSISALIHEDTNAADKMLARLGDFLRISLENSGAQMVTVGKEIESLQAYFEIERVRFRDTLDLRLEVEPATLDAQMPSFLWQPLLENAIHHGIATSETNGRITFRAKRKQEKLVLEVEDNGTGLPTNEQSRLKEGIGLANTRAILRHIYGSHHHFQVVQSKYGGAIAILEIPFRTMIPVQTESVGDHHDGNGSSEGARRGRRGAWQEENRPHVEGRS